MESLGLVCIWFCLLWLPVELTIQLSVHDFQYTVLIVSDNFRLSTLFVLAIAHDGADDAAYHVGQIRYIVLN